MIERLLTRFDQPAREDAHKGIVQSNNRHRMETADIYDDATTPIVWLIS